MRRIGAWSPPTTSGPSGSMRRLGLPAGIDRMRDVAARWPRPAPTDPAPVQLDHALPGRTATGAIALRRERGSSPQPPGGYQSRAAAADSSGPAAGRDRPPQRGTVRDVGRTVGLLRHTCRPAPSCAGRVAATIDEECDAMAGLETAVGRTTHSDTFETAARAGYVISGAKTSSAGYVARVSSSPARYRRM